MCFHRDSNQDGSNLDLVMGGTVGLLAPDVIGRSSHLCYFLSPYDRIDPKTKKMQTDFKQGGLCMCKVRWGTRCDLYTF